MNCKAPEEVPSGMEEDIELENFENPSDKIRAEVHRRWVPPQKIVFVDPILEKEDSYHNECSRWDDKTVEGHYECEDNVKGIHHGVVEFRPLQGLV